MGNKPSGGGDGGGTGIHEAITNTLSAISEHTMDWNDNDDDSIWDEASLAEDVHSLGESSRNGEADVNAIELLPTVIIITQKIEKAKYRLLKARSKTIEKRRDMKVEHKNCRSELKKTEKLLQKVAKKATSYFSYFDYFNMVKRSYNVKKDSNLNTSYFTNVQRNTTTSAASPTSNKPMSTALVTQANSFYFSVFALWEAYLLKKTHVAVMQHNQQKVQKKGWNKVIMHVTHEKDGVIEAFEDQEFELKGNIEALTADLTALRNAYTDLVRCQEKIIRKLQEHENWMSGSQLGAFSSDEEESSSESEDDSEESIPLEINTDKHDRVSLAGLSVDVVSIDTTESSEKKDSEKLIGHQEDEEVDLNDVNGKAVEKYEDQEVNLNDASDKAVEKYEGEEVDRNDANDKVVDQHEDEEVDLNDAEDEAVEESTPTDNTSEEENQERETTGEKATSKDSEPVSGVDTDPGSLETGMSSGSLPHEENKEGPVLSPVELKNEGLRDKMQELKENLRNSMRDLTLEQDEIW